MAITHVKLSDSIVALRKWISISFLVSSTEVAPVSPCLGRLSIFSYVRSRAPPRGMAVSKVCFPSDGLSIVGSISVIFSLRGPGTSLVFRTDVRRDL